MTLTCLCHITAYLVAAIDLPRQDVLTYARDVDTVLRVASRIVATAQWLHARICAVRARHRRSRSARGRHVKR